MRGKKPRETSFEELKELIGPLAGKYGICRIYLFGSRARGDNRDDSDYDMLV